MMTTTLRLAHPRIARFAVFGMLLGAFVACHSGPPKPLDEPADAHLPRWVSMAPATGPYDDVAGDTRADSTPPTPHPQTQPTRAPSTVPAAPAAAAERFPREFAAVGHSSLVDATLARNAAVNDGRDALRTLVQTRIRTALLTALESADEWPLAFRADVQQRIWTLDLTAYPADSAVQVRHVQRDDSGRVPLTVAEVVVSFASVLESALDAAERAFAAAPPEFPLPSPRRLARLLAPVSPR